MHPIMWTPYTPMLYTINSPTRITDNSKSLIDNRFYNDAIKNVNFNFRSPYTVSINLKTRCSTQMKKDHLEILIQLAFGEDLKRICWNEALTLSEENPNLSLKTFLDRVDRVIDKHCHKKRISKTKRQTKSKP